jgi:hypothetical protein
MRGGFHAWRADHRARVQHHGQHVTVRQREGGEGDWHMVVVWGGGRGQRGHAAVATQQPSPSPSRPAQPPPAPSHLLAPPVVGRPVGQQERAARCAAQCAGLRSDTSTRAHHPPATATAQGSQAPLPQAKSTFPPPPPLNGPSSTSLSPWRRGCLPAPASPWMPRESAVPAPRRRSCWTPTRGGEGKRVTLLSRRRVGGACAFGGGGGFGPTHRQQQRRGPLVVKFFRVCTPDSNQLSDGGRLVHERRRVQCSPARNLQQGSCSAPTQAGQHSHPRPHAHTRTHARVHT